MDEALADD